MYKIQFNNNTIFQLQVESNNYDNSQILIQEFKEFIYSLSGLFNITPVITFQQLYWNDSDELVLKIRFVANEVVNILDVTFE